MIDAALGVALFGLALLAGLFLLAPAFRAVPPREIDERAALEASHEAALRALHDLDLDWATGKLSEDDYRSQRSLLLAEASSVLRRLGRAEQEAGR